MKNKMASDNILSDHWRNQFYFRISVYIMLEMSTKSKKIVSMRYSLIIFLFSAVILSCNTSERYIIPKYSFDANNLTNDYIHNQKLIQDKYQGIIICVEGYVQSLNIDEKGGKIIQLEGINNSSIRCELNMDFTNDDSVKYSKIQKGQKIKVHGKLECNNKVLVICGCYL